MNLSILGYTCTYKYEVHCIYAANEIDPAKFYFINKEIHVTKTPRCKKIKYNQHEIANPGNRNVHHINPEVSNEERKKAPTVIW